MAANETSTGMTTSQVMTNVDGPPTVSEASPPPVDSRARLASAGIIPGAADGETAEETPLGVGVEGETVVWEARYAMRNFVGRIAARAVLTIAWIALAIYTWGYSDGSLGILTGLAGAGLLALWVVLIYRIMLARFGHYYRLTTRRLFVSTGMWRRRRDMLELLRVRDVFTRQTLLQRWLSVGTVVIVSSEPHFPIIYLTGVDAPKYVMDLVWHHARAERDRRSVKVDQI